MKTDLRLIQEQQPLVHNITNYVAMNFVANSLLAIGASPIMARAEEEVEEISSKSNALALNLGVSGKHHCSLDDTGRGSCHEKKNSYRI